MRSREAKDWHFDLDHHLNPYLPRNRISRLSKPLSRFLGYRDGPRPEVGNVLVAGWAFVGAFVGIVAIEALFMIPAIQNHGVPLLVASSGAAAILEFNAIESPFAQPRNSIVGHFISAVIGVGVTKLFFLNSDAEDLRWLAGAVACGLTSAGMALTGTIHPPAGATALLAAVDPQVQQLGWYLLPLVLLSSAITLVISLLLNNIQRQYPMYWWTPADLGKKKMGNDIEEKSTSSSTTYLGSKLLQHVEDTGQPMIRITRERIVVPDHICLASEERKILEILHQRLGDGLPRPPGPTIQL